MNKGVVIFYNYTNETRKVFNFDTYPQAKMFHGVMVTRPNSDAAIYEKVM